MVLGPFGPEDHGHVDVPGGRDAASLARRAKAM